jgi:hypothetical protein
MKEIIDCLPKGWLMETLEDAKWESEAYKIIARMSTIEKKNFVLQHRGKNG